MNFGKAPKYAAVFITLTAIGIGTGWLSFRYPAGSSATVVGISILVFLLISSAIYSVMVEVQSQSQLIIAVRILSAIGTPGLSLAIASRVATLIHHGTADVLFNQGGGVLILIVYVVMTYLFLIKNITLLRLVNAE